MKQKSSTQAVLALMQDAQQLKRVCGWRKTTVEFYSDYIDAEYRITDTIRAIPEHHADEWRMYAQDNELYLVLTYCFNPDLA